MLSQGAIKPVPAGRVAMADVGDGVEPPLSPLLALLALSIVLPVETSLMIGGLRLPMARLILLLGAPYICLRFAERISAGRYRFVLSDFFVLLAAAWMVFGSMSVIGVADGLNHAGPEALEFCFSYFAARTLLTARGHAVALVRLLCIVIAVVGVASALDSATDRFVIHDLARGMTGYAKDVVGRPDYRLGMRRAAGPLEHPILLGTACTIGLLCTWSLKFRGWALALAGCATGLIVSVSSAPLQAAIMGFGLLSYNRAFQSLRWRWALLLAALLGGIGLMYAIVGSPLGFVNEHLVFDPESGFSREFEWETVGQYVAASPWFGIGFGWDEIAEAIGAFASIDSVWLGKALIYGIPCSMLIALSFVGSASLPTSGAGVTLAPAETRLGTALGTIMCLLLFLGFTVYFWGSLWVLSALLAGIRAHLGELGHLNGNECDMD